MVTWEAQIKAQRGRRGQEGETSRAVQELAAASGKQRDALMEDTREISHTEEPIIHENLFIYYLYSPVEFVN